MTHLNIQQGLNIEVVSTNLIKKLYEVALSVPEPLEGELDAAYMSGNLLVDKSYRALVEYLTNRFDDLHINVTGNYYIEFEDPLVLSVLLANNFSSDGVGITESDAASANLLTKFANNSNITTFNEFKYFTSVNKTDTGSAQTFINCTNLSEIDLTEWEVALLRLFENTAITTVNAPKLSRYGSAWGAVGVFQTNSHLTTVQSLGHVTKIVSSMFANCINLETVNLPQECTTISENAFLISYNQGGGHLATINLDNITTIEDSAFQELRRLAKTLPTDMPNLTSIGNGAFKNCVALTGSINYQNLTSIGNNAFYGCSGLNGTINLPNLTSLGSHAFRECSGITSIDFTGSTFTTVGASTFRGCSNLTKLVLPTTVTTIGNEWVVDIPRLITVEGTDNIANYGTANPEFRNPIIRNPVKTGIANNFCSLFRVQGNSVNSGMSLHSLYEPLRKSTPVGIFLPGNQAKITLFWSSSSNSANANIGLYYLKDIETFGYMAFYGTTISNLVINNVTPPTLTTTEDSALMGYTTMYQNWGNVIFGPNSVIGTLWVPDSAVATYQANSLYSGLTIKGINTKTNGIDYDLPRYATYADWKTAEAAAVAQGGHAPQGLIEAWM